MKKAEVKCTTLIICIIILLLNVQQAIGGNLFIDDFESGNLDNWAIGGRQLGYNNIAEMVEIDGNLMAHLHHESFTEITIQKTFAYDPNLTFNFDMKTKVSSQASSTSAFYANAGVVFGFFDNLNQPIGWVVYYASTSSWRFDYPNDPPNIEQIRLPNDDLFHSYSLNVQDILGNIVIDEATIATVQIRFQPYASGWPYNMKADVWVDNVVVSATDINESPVAKVSEDYIQTYVGQTVSLDATPSYDADGDELTFSWLENPLNPSTGILGDPTAPVVDFTTLVPGIYGFTVVVSDGTTTSEISLTLDVYNLGGFLDTCEEDFSNSLTQRLLEIDEAINDLILNVADPVNAISSIGAVSNKISATRNYIEAQTGKKIKYETIVLLMPMLNSYQELIDGHLAFLEILDSVIKETEAEIVNGGIEIALSVPDVVLAYVTRMISGTIVSPEIMVQIGLVPEDMYCEYVVIEQGNSQYCVEVVQ